MCDLREGKTGDMYGLGEGKPGNIYNLREDKTGKICDSREGKSRNMGNMCDSREGFTVIAKVERVEETQYGKALRTESSKEDKVGGRSKKESKKLMVVMGTEEMSTENKESIKEESIKQGSSQKENESVRKAGRGEKSKIK